MLTSRSTDIIPPQQAEAELRLPSKKKNFPRPARVSKAARFHQHQQKLTGRQTLKINEALSADRFKPPRSDWQNGRSNIWADYSERRLLVDELDAMGRVRQKEMRVNGKLGQELLVSVSIELCHQKCSSACYSTPGTLTRAKLIEARSSTGLSRRAHRPAESAASTDRI